MTVPSCDVTPAMLVEWGFVLQTRDHCVGMLMVTKGMSFGEARHAAWVAGLTHIQSGTFTPRPLPTPDAEMVAWGLAQKGVTTA